VWWTLQSSHRCATRCRRLVAPERRRRRQQRAWQSDSEPSAGDGDSGHDLRDEDRIHPSCIYSISHGCHPKLDTDHLAANFRQGRRKCPVSSRAGRIGRCVVSSPRTQQSRTFRRSCRPLRTRPYGWRGAGCRPHRRRDARVSAHNYQPRSTQLTLARLQKCSSTADYSDYPGPSSVRRSQEERRSPSHRESHLGVSAPPRSSLQDGNGWLRWIGQGGRIGERCRARVHVLPAFSL